MALSNEDHKDVKGALGKAMANKISKVTRDYGKSDTSLSGKKWNAHDPKGDAKFKSGFEAAAARAKAARLAGK